MAHHWYATYLAVIGRHSQAVEEIERAQALDPVSKSILADKGDLLWAAGRHDEGLSLLKQLDTAEPDFISTHRYLKIAYSDSGDYPNFLAEWKKEASLMRDKATLKLVDAAEKGFADGGERGMLQNLRSMQKKLYSLGSQSAYALAQTDSLLGDKQEALQYLKIAYDKHDESFIQMRDDRSFANLHSEPAYQELVARLNLPSPR